MSEPNTTQTPRNKIVSGNWTRYNGQGNRYNIGKTTSGSLFLSGHGSLTSSARSETPPSKRGWTASTPRAKRQSSLVSSAQREKLDLMRKDSSSGGEGGRDSEHSSPLSVPRTPANLDITTSVTKSSSMTSIIRAPSLQIDGKQHNQGMPGKRGSEHSSPITVPGSPLNSAIVNSVSKSSSMTSIIKAPSLRIDGKQQNQGVTGSALSSPLSTSTQTPSISATPQSPISLTPVTLSVQTPPIGMNTQPLINDNKVPITNEVTKLDDPEHIMNGGDSNQEVRSRVFSGPSVVQPRTTVGTVTDSLSPVHSHLRRQAPQGRRLSENSSGLHMLSEPHFTNIGNSNTGSGASSTEISSPMSPLALHPVINVEQNETEDGFIILSEGEEEEEEEAISTKDKKDKKKKERKDRKRWKGKETKEVVKNEKEILEEPKGNCEEEKKEENEEKDKKEEEEEGDDRYKIVPVDPNISQNSFPIATLATELFSYPKVAETHRERPKKMFSAWDDTDIFQPRQPQAGDARYEESSFVIDGTTLPSLEFIFGAKDSYGMEIDLHTMMRSTDNYGVITSEALITSGISFNPKNESFNIDTTKYEQEVMNIVKEKQKSVIASISNAQPKKEGEGGDEKEKKEKERTNTVKKAQIVVPEKMETVIDVERCEPSKVTDTLLGTTASVEQARQLEVTQDDLKGKNVIKICICGTSNSGRGTWITRLFGYSNIYLPNFNYLSKKVKINGVVNNIIFTMCNVDEDVSASLKYRWADAFVLAFSAHDRKSYDSIQNISKDIVKDNGGRYKPTLVAMNITNKYRDSSTWCVPPPELALFSESLNSKLFKCDTPTSVMESFKSLCISFKSKRAVTSLKTLNHSASINFSSPSFKNNRLLPLQSQKLDLKNTKPKAQLTTKTVCEFVILGDSFSGKTTFVNKFIKGGFTKGYLPTTTVLNRRRVIMTNGGRNECSVKLIDTPGLFFIEHGTAPESEDPIDYSVEETINWLKRESLLHAQGYIIMFSYTSSQSFEYAFKLLKALKAIPTEMNTGSLSGHLIGTKCDLKYNFTVSRKGAEAYAKMLNSEVSSLSLKTITHENLTLVVDKIISNFMSQKRSIQNGISQSIASRQGYMSYGKEKNKCKLRSYFVLFDGVLRFGNDFKECIPITSTSIIESINTEGSRSKTDASLHLNTLRQEIWLLPPPGERDLWFSSFTNVIQKCPYKGSIEGPFRPIPPGFVKIDQMAQNASAKTLSEPGKSTHATSGLSSPEIAPVIGDDYEKKRHTFKGTLIKKKK